MTRKEKCVKLALAEGFISTKQAWSYMGESGINTYYNLHNARHEVILTGLPDYFTDLNVMKRVRRTLLKTEDQQSEFISNLSRFDFDFSRSASECIYELLDMDAANQAEALGWTLELWDEETIGIYADYSVRILTKEGKTQTVEANEISDFFAVDWCRKHDRNPEGMVADDLRARVPSTSRLWLEQYVLSQMFPGAQLLVQETSPEENEEGSLCGLCDGTHEHSHPMSKCVKCRAMGLAENMAKHVCKV